MRPRYLDPNRWVVWCLNKLAYKSDNSSIKVTNIAHMARALLGGVMGWLPDWYIERERIFQLAACPATLQDIQTFLNRWYGVGAVGISELDEATGIYEPLNHDGVTDPVPEEDCWGWVDGQYGLLGDGATANVSISYNPDMLTDEDISRLEGELRILIPFWVQYNVA